MQRVDVVVAGFLFEDLTPYTHGDHEIVFHQWTRMSDLPLSNEPFKAYIAWTLPGTTGLELCRQLRCDPLTARSHITLVLEGDAAEDRRRAIRAWANDYMIAPITREAVLDKIIWAKKHEVDHKALRTLQHGELNMDLSAFRVDWRGSPVALMPNEFRLLRFLMENPSRVMTRAQLLTAVGKSNTPANERMVDVWIGRIRRSLRKVGAGEPLRTVRSLGYVLDAPETLHVWRKLAFACYAVFGLAASFADLGLEYLSA